MPRCPLGNLALNNSLLLYHNRCPGQTGKSWEPGAKVRFPLSQGSISEYVYPKGRILRGMVKPNTQRAVCLGLQRHFCATVSHPKAGNSINVRASGNTATRKKKRTTPPSCWINLNGKFWANESQVHGSWRDSGRQRRSRREAANRTMSHFGAHP